MTAFEPLSTRQDWARPTESDWAEVVARMPLFARVGRWQLHRLTRDAEVATFVPGDIVIPANAPADFFYVVLAGEGEVRDGSGARRLGPGDYFGETALLNAANRGATVVATNELSVIRLSGAVFLRVVQRSPRVAVAMLRELGDRVARGEPQPLPDAA
jgi:CRP-like cAMP-binding protein